MTPESRKLLSESKKGKPAWNKGKTGIYSIETIEKIRNAAIKQMGDGRIKKSGQEILFENYLIDNDIKYI
jgi:hypothetical protein